MQIAWRKPSDASASEPGNAPGLAEAHAPDTAEPGEDDDALVLAAQANPAAFAALWERYHDPIRRYCQHQLHVAEEAEDAANQTFLDAFAALARFEVGRSSFRSWLFAIAHNEIVSRQRRNPRFAFLPLFDRFTHAAAGELPERSPASTRTH